MKNSIISTGGNYSTSRMLVDYTQKLYMPLANLYNKYYTDLTTVGEFNEWKRETYRNWNNIIIKEQDNLNNVSVDAGDCIKVACEVTLPNISIENIEVQVYYGRIKDNGIVEKIAVIPHSKNSRPQIYNMCNLREAYMCAWRRTLLMDESS